MHKSIPKINLNPQNLNTPEFFSGYPRLPPWFMMILIKMDKNSVCSKMLEQTSFCSACGQFNWFFQNWTRDLFVQPGILCC